MSFRSKTFLQTTIDISKQSLKKGVLLGTDRILLYDWLKFKPANTIILLLERTLCPVQVFVFSLATTGVLGLFSIIALLIVLLSQYRKVFYGGQSKVTTSNHCFFFGVIYL